MLRNQIWFKDTPHQSHVLTLTDCCKFQRYDLSIYMQTFVPVFGQLINNIHTNHSGCLLLLFNCIKVAKRSSKSCWSKVEKGARSAVGARRKTSTSCSTPKLHMWCLNRCCPTRYMCNAPHNTTRPFPCGWWSGQVGLLRDFLNLQAQNTTSVDRSDPHTITPLHWKRGQLTLGIAITLDRYWNIYMIWRFCDEYFRSYSGHQAEQYGRNHQKTHRFEMAILSDSSRFATLYRYSPQCWLGVKEAFLSPSEVRCSKCVKSWDYNTKVKCL